MSKLKRSALKSVVKECLLEILSEGINTQQAPNIQPRGNAVASQALAETKQIETAPSMKEAIAGITSDPILASVLGDTAQTTLVEQAGADRQGQLRQMRVPGAGGQDNTAQVAEQDGESHWAALAFAEKKTV